MDDDTRTQTTPPRDPQPSAGVQPTPTTPTEEWGDRVETGRKIGRGGHEDGPVPGATGDEPADPRSGQSPAAGG